MLKKIAIVMAATTIVGLVGCTGTKKMDAHGSGTYSERTNGMQTSSNMYGEVLSPEQELALLNQKVVHFAYDDYNISAQDQRVLNVHAKHMLEHPNLALQINGHTDERGSRDYNIALGANRANSVSRYLETKGVPSNRLSSVSYGKEQPISLESNEAAWSQNRRAELQYSDLG